ncbi:MAG TPA: hypothetical protein VNT76_01205 [Candidatus Binatus sp.]|nr:hypothetical protein [Candidatus Binatus sp.]
MKPTITKQKDIRGRVRSHCATIGPVTYSSAVSAADAIVNCERETTAALERLDRGTIIRRWNGHIYIVSPDAFGWRAWCDVFSQTDYYIGSSGTREEAEDAILHHLASIVWTHEDDDHAFVATLPERMRADLLKRFAWYRAMKTFMAQGYTDDQARQMIADGIVPAVA